MLSPTQATLIMPWYLLGRRVGARRNAHALNKRTRPNTTGKVATSRFIGCFTMNQLTGHHESSEAPAMQAAIRGQDECMPERRASHGRRAELYDAHLEWGSRSSPLRNWNCRQSRGLACQKLEWNSYWPESISKTARSFSRRSNFTPRLRSAGTRPS